LELCSKGDSSVIIVSLTTIPPNMFALSLQIDKLLDEQITKPDLIIINVAKEYARFEREALFLNLKSTHEKVLINFCTDSGPATKLVGLFESGVDIKDDDTIIIIDDDVDYPEELCRDYVETFDIIKNEHDTVLGVVGCSLEQRGWHTIKFPFGLTEFTEFNGSHLKKVNMVQGWGSYGLKGAALKKLKQVYSIHLFPDYVFYQDDIFISNIAQKHLDIRVIQTQGLWTHRQVDTGSPDPPTNDHERDQTKFGLNKTVVAEKNKNLCPAQEFSEKFQLHKDEQLGGGEGKDGNTEKNLKSLSLLIEKGICNFAIEDERKNEILFHNFVYEFGKLVEYEDIKDLTVEECIDLLKGLQKKRNHN